MARYRMLDGTVIDTDKSKNHWDEGSEFDGNNMISTATGTQWDHQKLYQSRKGRYYVEHTSQWQGSRGHCEWVSLQEAARWMLAQGFEAEEMPAELAALVDDVSE